MHHECKGECWEMGFVLSASFVLCYYEGHTGPPEVHIFSERRATSNTICNDGVDGDKRHMGITKVLYFIYKE